MIRKICFFIRLLELKDAYTANHLKRVTKLAVDFANFLSCSQKEIEIIRYGSILHDIGKIGIPDEIIKNKGKLTDKEISPYCKIVTICDCFDAITSDRVYQSKLSYHQALLELELNKGAQFDSLFTQYFIKFITKRKEEF